MKVDVTAALDGYIADAATTMVGATAVGQLPLEAWQGSAELLRMSRSLHVLT